MQEVSLEKSKKFTPTWSPPTWSKSLIVLVTYGIVPSSPSPLPPIPPSRKGTVPYTSYFVPWSSTAASTRSPSLSALDEKPINTGLMKFLGHCPSALSWYLEFASAFSTSSAPFRPMLSLYESKGSMTPQKSRLCSTMVLPSPWPYYPLPCICIPSFAIGRSASAALWCSSESTSFLTNALILLVAEPHWTRRRFLTPFDHLLQHHCAFIAVLLGRWKDRLQISCMASAILLQGSRRFCSP
ncbi:hypothetical protein BHE74_00016087 [Ensete ventricosum]|nr:hypothetical protein BHE74_00016087 [Ensete ventricosum]RZR86546.1 hypothetical protein BHM03_00013769 [Ensete ventricosum]